MTVTPLPRIRRHGHPRDEARPHPTFRRVAVPESMNERHLLEGVWNKQQNIIANGELDKLSSYIV